LFRWKFGNVSSGRRHADAAEADRDFVAATANAWNLVVARFGRYDGLFSPDAGNGQEMWAGGLGAFLVAERGQFGPATAQERCRREAVSSPNQRPIVRVRRASPSSGVNTVTGKGLAQVLAGAQVVVDVSNAPNWEDNAVLAFFETSGRNLLAAEAAAGVGHHVALSVVGTDRLLASGYFRAKLAQEKLIKASRIPYTIVRATQFFEFVGGIAQSATEGQTVRLPPVLMKPIASDDVAAVLADVALAKPLNGTVELVGPELIRQDDLVLRFLNATGDARTVIANPQALYFGIAVNDQSLTPGDHPRIGSTRFEDWLSHNAEPVAAAARGVR